MVLGQLRHESTCIDFWRFASNLGLLCLLRLSRPLLLLGFGSKLRTELWLLAVTGLREARLLRNLVFTDLFVNELAALLSQALFPGLSSHLYGTHSRLQVLALECWPTEHIL